MDDKIFVVAIGGTGMRCLENFVHLCAIGMFDNKEIDVLTLDTDQENGNKKRVEQLVEQYMRIKTPQGADATSQGGRPASNTFFSAKLRLTKYHMNYTGGRESYQNLSKVGSADDVSKDLINLFFDDKVQKFNLAHGYRAQTHLGSMLMYHGIIESAIKHKNGASEGYEKEFIDYLKRIFDAGAKAKVFVFGSIFGGTGASSIPVIPKAFADAYNTVEDTKKQLEAKFAASLLTEYFTFTPPTAAQKSKVGNEVIASANNFTLNSQAALQFYQNDPTVKKTYKALYHVGWPVSRQDFSAGKNETETKTGGGNQKNPCHITELLCAFAAYDFINYGDKYVENDAQYLVRAAEMENGSFNFGFKDLCEDDNKLKNSLAGFYSLCLFTLQYQGGMGANQEGITGWITRMKEQGFLMYEGQIAAADKKEINDYMKKFLFEVDNNGNLIKGWLYQVRDSFYGKFLLPQTSFPTDLQGIKAINPGCLLPDDVSKWGMKKSGSFGFGGPKPKDVADTFSDFINEFKEEHNFASEEFTSGKDRLIAHMYNTITRLQKVITQ